MRRASRLDKIRWLIVYSADFMNLLALTSIVELYVLWAKDIMPLPLAAGASVLALVFYGLSTRPFRIITRGGKPPVALLTVAGVIAVGAAGIGLVWMMPVWLGMLSPYIRKGPFSVLAAVSIGLFNGYIAVLSEFTPSLLVLQFLATLLVSGGSLANVWIWRVAQEAHEGQEAKARLAVSEERLRFARDLNDLLGQSLTDIAAKTGLAEDTLAADPGRAADEMFEVRDLARLSLREVRTAVQNYRALDLGEVLASVRAVLEAADVHCTIDADTDELPAETRTLLAQVVREGATNILKHSTAQRCRITIRNGVLEMTNDGIPESAGEPGGLRGLSDRLSAAGGSLTAGAADGTYLLRAAV